MLRFGSQTETSLMDRHASEPQNEKCLVNHPSGGPKTNNSIYSGETRIKRGFKNANCTIHQVGASCKHLPYVHFHVPGV